MTSHYEQAMIDALLPILEVETNTRLRHDNFCPLCNERNLERCRAYCAEWQDGKPTKAVLVCTTCASTAHHQAGVRTAALDVFKGWQSGARRAAGTPNGNTLSTPAVTKDSWLYRLLLAAGSVLDLHALHDDECELCSHVLERGDPPMRVYFTNSPDDGRFDKYCLVCGHCAQQARDEEGIEMMGRDKFVFTLLQTLAKILKVKSFET